MTGLWVLVVVLVAATAFGLWFQRVNGRIREAKVAGLQQVATNAPPVDITSHDRAPRMESALGAAIRGRMGEKATMVQFSTAFCQPCRATRRILEEVSVMVPGVSHVEIDAEDHLDLVRDLDIRRTPTVLFLDASGAIRKQASGQPRKADVIAVLGDLVAKPGDPSDFEI